MREIKLRVPPGRAGDVFRLAREAGIDGTTTHLVRVRSADGEGDAAEVVVKSSAPRIKAFLAALARAPFYERRRDAFSCHEIRAVVGREPVAELTVPLCVPFCDVQQDLWQQVHLTPSLLARTAVSAALVAYALIKDDPVLSVGAMIFSPFSPLFLALGFSLAGGGPALARRAASTLAWCLALSAGAAAAAAAVAGGPVLDERAVPPAPSFAMSAALGVMAALADSDEVGRRQLIGLAMIYPFVKLVVWFGVRAALGFPGEEALRRLGTLGGNAALMTAASALAYRALGRRGELERLPP